ncbi:putative uncharacterized protein DDB_G0274435 [Drosophila virilis]|uniref:Uncharacterized protein n=1 Tax=Drosophila virilis TaxID=7244 RepID=B4LU90_DROVI|nr:regulator of nonsense transcripts 1 [Drosophila virilis]EDW64077.2 uncharacterized protein Dvir_GJ24483 [Drosophila virilis]
MDAYSKYLHDEQFNTNQGSTQTESNAPMHSHPTVLRQRLQFNNSSSSNPRVSTRCKKMRQEKSKTQPRPKEVIQKATQTCIRHSQPPPEPHSRKIRPPNQPQQKQQQQQQQQQQNFRHTETQVHRCPNRATRQVDAPSYRMELSYMQPKSLFNVDYAPQSRRALRLPPLPPSNKASMLDRDGAGGDRLLYRNSNFGKESSRGRSENSEDPLFNPVEVKESSSMLQSAREHCRKTKAHFNAKYADKNDPGTDSDSKCDSDNSLKTVITTKSGENLRTVVRSQIEMQELLHQSINKMTEMTDRLVLSTNSRLILPSLGLSGESECSLIQKNTPNLSKSPANPQKDVRGSAGWAPGTRSENPLCLEELVSTKVIAPMMRRVQRMYLNNLQEEMKLMEELERVPCQVSDLYKSADVPPGLSKQLK